MQSSFLKTQREKITKDLWDQNHQNIHERDDQDEDNDGLVCHGLGYFGILLAMSWSRIFWD